MQLSPFSLWMECQQSHLFSSPFHSSRRALPPPTLPTQSPPCSQAHGKTPTDTQIPSGGWGACPHHSQDHQPTVRLSPTPRGAPFLFVSFSSPDPCPEPAPCSESLPIEFGLCHDSRGDECPTGDPNGQMLGSWRAWRTGHPTQRSEIHRSEGDRQQNNVEHTTTIPGVGSDRRRRSSSSVSFQIQTSKNAIRSSSFHPINPFPCVCRSVAGSRVCDTRTATGPDGSIRVEQNPKKTTLSAVKHTHTSRPKNKRQADAAGG
ncbi:hypothetical protein QBC39DRAFT_87332 [Podospora conica]|nr:hypothetical protein QBC39DRAFT_87332 [Schizothecium conicum]